MKNTIYVGQERFAKLVRELQEQGLAFIAREEAEGWLIEIFGF